MDFKFNKDQDLRDSLLPFKEGRWDSEYLGGIRRFEGLDVETFGMLLHMDFIDPTDRQNNAPPAKRFYEFMKKYPEFKAHGYAVHKERDDYRISIEGLMGTGLSDEAVTAFRTLSRGADERTIDATTRACYNWWD